MAMEDVMITESTRYYRWPAAEMRKMKKEFKKMKRMVNGFKAKQKELEMPDTKVNTPVVRDREIKDMGEWAAPNNADYIVLSSVQSAEDVKERRQHCSNWPIKVISNIETEEGMMNFDAILAESDGIMVTRGDFGMEISLKKVLMAQKMICLVPENQSEFLEERRLNDFVKPSESRGFPTELHVDKPKEKEVNHTEKEDDSDDDGDFGNKEESEEEESEEEKENDAGKTETDTSESEEEEEEEVENGEAYSKFSKQSKEKEDKEEDEEVRKLKVQLELATT